MHLMSDKPCTISVIIINTKLLFTLDYGGLFILIPYYLKQIKNILNGDFNNKTKSAAVTILGSLLHIPIHYPNYKIPSITKDTAKITMKEIDGTIKELIFTFIKQSKDSKIICKAICCTTIIIYFEASKPKPCFEQIKVNSVMTYRNTYY